MKEVKSNVESGENRNWRNDSIKEDLLSSVLYREYLELTQKNRKYRMRSQI